MSASALDAQETAQSKQVVRFAGVVAVAVALSRFTGLIREMILANLFGAGYSFDAFSLAYRIPNISRELFAEGALASAFIPSFAGTLQREGKNSAAEVFTVVSSATIAVVGLFCVLGMVFAPQLVHLLAPGFAAVPGKTELAVVLTRIMFPFLLVISLSAQVSGILNSNNHFGTAALASTFFNIGSIVAGLLIGFWLGPQFGMPAIEGMAYGVLIGGVFQLLCQVPRLYECGYRFRFALDWSHPVLQKIVKLMLPALFGAIAVQINVIVNTSFASKLSDPLRGHDGAVSWLGYALRFVQLPLGLFGVAIASAMLPAVARDAAIHDFEQFRKTFSRSLGVLLLCTVPSMVILILLGRPIISAVYQSGRFDAYDAHQTSIALSCYALGLLAFAATRILTPAFYALCDSRTPMYASILSILLNVALPLLFIKLLRLGFASLALTTSIAVTVECLLLFELLRRKLGGIEGHYLVGRFRKIAGAAVMMGVAIECARLFMSPVEIADRWTAMAQLALCLPVAIAAFGLASYALKIHEMRVVGDAFLFALKRLLHHPHAKIRI